MAFNENFFSGKVIIYGIFFCSMIQGMDVGMPQTAKAVFAEKNIMQKNLLSQCSLQSLVRLATTCKNFQSFLFENICFHLPEDSTCLEELKKQDLDYCKIILSHYVQLKNKDVFKFMWNLRSIDLEKDLKKLSHLQTISITPDMAFEIYKTNYDQLEKNYKKDAKKALKESKKLRAHYGYQLRMKLFYGTVGEIKHYLNLLGEVDAFGIIPPGSYGVEFFLAEKNAPLPRGERLKYIPSVFGTVCYHNDLNIALMLLGRYIAEKPNKAAHYLLDGGHYRLFAQMAEQKKIDVNFTDKKGRSGLHYAAQRNDVNTTTLLLQCGALVNCCDKKGRTPLHYGCKYGSLNMIEYLLDFDGINPHQKDLNDKEPADLLDKKNQVVKLLIKQHDPEKKDQNN